MGNKADTLIATNGACHHENGAFGKQTTTLASTIPIKKPSTQRSVRFIASSKTMVAKKEFRHVSKTGGTSQIRPLFFIASLMNGFARTGIMTQRINHIFALNNDIGARFQFRIGLNHVQ